MIRLAPCVALLTLSWTSLARAYTCDGTGAHPSNTIVVSGCTAADAAGDSCVLGCATGYNQSGGSTTQVCNSPGGPYAFDLICTAVDCGTYTGAPVNSQVPPSCTGTTYNNTCSYNCNTGFYAPGSTTVTCDATGNWTSGSQCLAITCSSGSIPSHSQIFSGCTAMDAYGSSCVLQCATGYEQTAGTTTRSCVTNGPYPASDLVCSGITCSNSASQPAHSHTASGCTGSDAYLASCTLACDAGYFQSSGSTTRTCNGASSGPYPSSDLVCAACTSCAAGSYASTACTATSDAVCTACTAGTYSAAGASTCTPCPAGTYSEANASECTPCAAGSASTAGQNTCVSCEAGTFADAGAATCSQCPAGTFAPAGSPSCTDCPAGTIALAGDGACTACGPGSFASTTGSTSCSECAPGTFAMTAGATSCTACPSDTFALGAAAICQSCDCDDGDPCTADACDPTTGCSHTPIACADLQANDDMSISTDQHSGCDVSGAHGASGIPLALCLLLCAIVLARRTA